MSIFEIPLKLSIIRNCNQDFPGLVTGFHMKQELVIATRSYRSDRHTSESPVPQTNDFVEYRRTSAVLDYSIPQSRPETDSITPTSGELHFEHMLLKMTFRLLHNNY